MQENWTKLGGFTTFVFFILASLAAPQERGQVGMQSASAQESLPNVVSIFSRHKDSVVSIQTKVHNPSREFFFDRSGPRMGQGSGFVIDTNGYILTNNHVVQGASQITVVFHKGKKYSATLVGTDRKTDIALLKIDPGSDKIPAVSLGDSERIQVGQWVVAIGNPFGLSSTVTAGIISAMGRDIGQGPYDDFIQTDASINPGNSGGPLFDLKGRVIGVNTAIIKGGQGIGFAVPINLVRRVVDQLRERGHVVRGYVGAGLQELDKNLAKSFGVAAGDGVLIGSTERRGPADVAGMRPGDLVTHFAGRRVRSVRELMLGVAETAPNTEAAVEIIRDGKRKRLKVRIAERPDTEHGRVIPARTDKTQNKWLGISLREVDLALARKSGLDKAQGVMIENIAPSSPTARALRAGDIILRVGKRTVNTPKEFQTAVGRVRNGLLRMLVIRNGRSLFVAVKI
jgi:serine protease Do